MAPKPSHAPSRTVVFYNPRMAFNRDLSILTLKAHVEAVRAEGLRICDAMTGVGARGIRYAKEVEEVSEVILNDLNPIALQFAEYNSYVNKVNEKVRIVHDEANRTLSLSSTPDSRFDLVDLDPFGTPVPYLDSGVRALRIGGIIAATATDLPVLYGIHPKAARRRYGVSTHPTDYGHELAIRILIQTIIRVAAAHEMASYPIFCYYADHYVRVNLVLKRGKENINNLFDQLGYVEDCRKCGHRRALLQLDELSKRCPVCGSELKHIGPVWLGPLFDEEYCRRIIRLASSIPLRRASRIRKFLNLALEEAGSPPLFYSLSLICDRLNVPQMKPSEVVDALRELGYKASRTHIQGDAVKTDAPVSVVEEVLKP
ncbi:MAG: tRNA (guanine(10)-N(2))-dimethyltransferase [Candidatus Bathyarchaeia archaeon]|nr:tRNA (guanine(10)-N(2))-dimethyltransferase [Candidatus Bathyarchaeota archaeon]